ncbi:hypothetical protein FNV43_RR25167 [Rhamnella rubrinervis]|uniref:Uncharacterized protein n=1 Tax=Rhamnella rubrinervis TaxID=2594499 RepID=A0A8K0GPU6_9ROSA|nr:hypothetical protein FNV43_RR25167 [Rhamnella rubrinervis]
MPIAESVKLNQSNPEGHQHKQFDREVREMVAAITHRLTDLHKSGSSTHYAVEDDNGARIITLAGNNSGATLRSELDGKTGLEDELTLGESDALSTFVNSNFQAVNNSMMMGGSYTTNDPGVHVEISDFVEPHEPKPREWKGKKKDKEAIKRDQVLSERSDQNHEEN